jgi:glutamate--cysteine ligase
VRDLAHEAVMIAVDGLRARGRRNQEGYDETIFLSPLQTIIEGGPTQAEHWLERYGTEWMGDVSHIFEEAAI